MRYASAKPWSRRIRSRWSSPHTTSSRITDRSSTEASPYAAASATTFSRCRPSMHSGAMTCSSPLKLRTPGSTSTASAPSTMCPMAPKSSGRSRSIRASAWFARLPSRYPRRAQSLRAASGPAASGARAAAGTSTIQVLPNWAECNGRMLKVSSEEKSHGAEVDKITVMPVQRRPRAAVTVVRSRARSEIAHHGRGPHRLP
ncbi:hypothetical protein [Streptomyces sp. NPDC003036]|uniref:hypothetical protein n=1 Tax=Streptomyces sp. NPDC003036 TaxID=3154442 RepID=UPI0033BE45D8